MKSMTLVNFVTAMGGETTTPIGPLYVASILEQAGCEVDFRDYQVASYQHPLNEESMLDFVSDASETMGFSCYFNMLPFVLRCAREVKAEHPEKTIMLGGPGPSSAAERIMHQFPFIDVVVRGEGEHTVRELAEGVPYGKIKGIVYRSHGDVVVTPLRERIHALDDLPFPAYDKVDVLQYDNAGIITTRGCPYHCSFCEVAPLWGHHTERRSVSHVISEMRLLHDSYGVTSVHFNDDTFVLSREWVVDFCDALREEGLDVTWRCLGRINLMDEDLLSRMADAGCVGIQYGVESGSERVLKLMGKKITVRQVKDVVEMSLAHIKNVGSSFIGGFPFETMNDLYETMYLMGTVAKMGCMVKFFFLSPLLLSPLYNEYRSQLEFDENLVSNLLSGVLKEIPPAEKEEIVEMIKESPDIFSGFFYIHTPDVEEKYRVLNEAGLIL